MIYDCVNLNFINHFNALFVFLYFYVFPSYSVSIQKNYDPPHFFNKLSISLFPVDPKQFSFQVSFKKFALQHYLYASRPAWRRRSWS